MANQVSRAFLRDLGAFIQLPGYLCLPSFIVILALQEWYALIPFGALAIISFGIGQLLKYFFRGDEETESGSSYALISLVWVILPLLGTLPFLGVALLIPESNSQIAIFKDFNNAFFEAMSGFTGTGLTMLDDSSKIPHALQWWRSITEWVGGLGIIFMAVAILDTAHKDERLYQSEAMGWKSQSKKPENKIRKIIWIYLIYTAVSILTFLLAGMPFWEALNHGITGIATGGFTVTKDSFVSYSNAIKWAAIPVMLLGSFSFKIHVLVFEGKFRDLIKQTQLKHLMITFVLLLGILLLTNYQANTVDIFFQTASALGTCGFNSVKLSQWLPLFLTPLLIAMFIGGNSSSTTGGVKTQRIAWLLKSIKENIRQALMPDKEKDKYKFSVKYNGKTVENEQAFQKIRIAGILLLCWIMTIFLGTFFLSFILHGYQFSFFNILFDVTSALNNVGLSSGVTNHALPAAAKWVLNVIMWIGRLEILGVLVMFSFFFSNKRKSTAD